MTRYIANRLLQLPLLLLVVSALVFTILRLGPGSPVDLATEAARDPKEIERIRHEWGLDLPIHIQYINYMSGVVRGDFGRSFFSNTPVSNVVAERFPATLELAILGMILGSLFGISMGILSAVKENTVVDTLARAIALTGISMPTFWLGLMFIGLFAVNLAWLPVGGRFDARTPIETVTRFYVVDGLLAGDLAAVRTALAHMIMPASVLALFIAGFIARITRAMVLEALRQDYIRTARAKGLRERLVVIRHGLRNALLPIVTIMGLQFGNLLGGAAVTETVFSWPGLGKLMVDAINLHDFPQVQASILLLATTYVVVNLIVDVLYVFIDPRIRYGTD
ncbi:MAG: ABC transporter permease [Chloroflexi bacterium]|nr:ABC transporter permease [Chloroflexota bacterium]